ncbi:MAG TPA: hypothetical protein VMT50_01775, partial [Steroidobacteraceae bacterium]|nr:hypothetical protein [Steroidobacteraceae bacterium]
MKARKVLIAGLALLLLAGAAAFLYRLFYTEDGLRFALRQLEHIETVKVRVTGASGTLAGPLSADRIVVDHRTVHVEVRGLQVRPRIAALLGGAIRLEGLSASSVTVALKAHEPEPESTPHFLPAGLRIVAPEFSLRELSLTLENGTRFGLDHAYGSLRLSRSRLAVEHLTLDDRNGQLTGEVLLRAATPLGLRGSLGGRWRLTDGRTYRFTAAVDGDLDRLHSDVALTEPAQLRWSGWLLELTRQAHLSGVLRATDFDGSPWIAVGVLPKLSGSLAVVASAQSTGFDGALTSPTIDGGPLRIQGACAWHAGTLEINGVRAWLPRLGSELSADGTVSFGDGPPRLALKGGWTGLRWPLSGPPAVESPEGRYSLDGALPYAFRVRARLQGPAIPETALEAGGSLGAERLLLERLNAATLGGSLRGAGQLQWSAPQSWRLQVDGRDLDIGRIRPGVPGKISAVGSIEGRGFSASSPWTVRVASLSGTLFGRALTG